MSLFERFSQQPTHDNSHFQYPLVNFICSLEALIGVLYSGFCGAILFGKVLRIQSHAQVIFCDPVVIRYGPGLKESGDDRDASGSGDEDENSQEDTEAVDKMPCPVLEFRIVNRLYNEPGGEIMDGEKPKPACSATVIHLHMYVCLAPGFAPLISFFYCLLVILLD